MLFFIFLTSKIQTIAKDAGLDLTVEKEGNDDIREGKSTIVAETLQTGSTLVIDEFDCYIHPRAIMNIIEVFHNSAINIKHAQLIFNTHNPLYLGNNLFRRDEIKFIDRDDGTKCSHYYSLSDFGTKGSNARKEKDYMKHYFMNEYGAIRDIDFTKLFEKIVKEEQ